MIFDQYFSSIGGNTQTGQKKTEDETFKKTTNRIYKYENIPQNIIQQKHIGETKQVNKTMGVIGSGIKNEKVPQL